MTLEPPPSVKAFHWQDAYEGLHAHVSEDARLWAVTIADRQADHAAHVELAALISSSHMGGYWAAHYGAVDLIRREVLLGRPFSDLAQWLYETATAVVEWKTRPAVTVALETVPAPTATFELDPALAGRLPAEGIEFARMLAGRQRSRRLVIAARTLIGSGAAGVFNSGADCSRILLDVDGPDLVTAFAHELAHAADPDLCSPDREHFAYHLAPILVAAWPRSIQVLAGLIAETEQAIGRARVEPVDIWSVLDAVLLFATAPLRRVVVAPALVSSLQANTDPARAAISLASVNASSREGPVGRDDDPTMTR